MRSKNDLFSVSTAYIDISLMDSRKTSAWPVSTNTKHLNTQQSCFSLSPALEEICTKTEKWCFPSSSSHELKPADTAHSTTDETEATAFWTLIKEHSMAARGHTKGPISIGSCHKQQKL